MKKRKEDRRRAKMREEEIGREGKSGDERTREGKIDYGRILESMRIREKERV